MRIHKRPALVLFKRKTVSGFETCENVFTVLVIKKNVCKNNNDICQIRKQGKTLSQYPLFAKIWESR